MEEEEAVDYVVYSVAEDSIVLIIYQKQLNSQTFESCTMQNQRRKGGGGEGDAELRTRSFD